MCECFSCFMSVHHHCHMQVTDGCELSVMLGLGTEPGAHGRAVNALNSELSLQTEKNYFNHCTCTDYLSFSSLISFIHFSFI